MPQTSAFTPVNVTNFGVTRSGETVFLYTLTNKNGMVVQITNFGGIVTSLTAPDRDGVFRNIVLGFNTLDQYESESPYFGALIGRFGNRIAKGRFTLDGTEYALPVNNGGNHLHGGHLGFDKVAWVGTASETATGPGLLLSYVSRDGEEGYPGTLSVQVRYTLTHNNSLVIDYTAETDKSTPVNLTHHSYFNLAANPEQDVLGHILQIHAASFTPVESTLVPTGEFRRVGGTPFDFRAPKPIGKDINADDEQIRFGGGYDHNFIVSVADDDELRHVATLTDPGSGRVMEVHSKEPGVQLYTGNFLDQVQQENGEPFKNRSGLCLETQHFPDSPNQSQFPCAILQPGRALESTTIYSFYSDSELRNTHERTESTAV